MKQVTFKVYPGSTSNCEATATIVNGVVEKVKLNTKVPRGQYYSVYNDACEEAEKLTERIDITPEHLHQLRKKYADCEGMSDEQIIEALQLYENRPNTVLWYLCFPTFDCYLRKVKDK